MESKNLEEALRYISLELKHDPKINKTDLIEKAGKKYNLNPLETDFLFEKYIFSNPENQSDEYQEEKSL